MTAKVQPGEPDEAVGASVEEAGWASRRTVLTVGAAAVGGAGVALLAAKQLGVPFLGGKGSVDAALSATSVALGDGLFYIENFPTSPLILSPFTDPLPVPKALRPVPKTEYSAWTNAPGGGVGEQNSLRNQQHQIWPSAIPAIGDWGKETGGRGGSPDPIVYKIDHLVSTHSFTTSQVLPIDSGGHPTASFDAAGKTYPAGTKRTLPLSTIYGFNGVFPGPMINNEYGHPTLVRFTNRLDENPQNLDRQDFGAPDW